MNDEKTLFGLDPETAWQPLFPTPSTWNAAKLAHLHRRAEFGASRARLEETSFVPPAELVASIVEGREDRRYEEDVDRLRETALARSDIRSLQALWIYRMMHSPHPLRERMTLFWHDHFATSHAKVGNYRLMQRQNELLRRHALGHFGEMLQEITRDPAMLIWLDSHTNRVGHANENYAREIFELFGLGVGHYTEADILEAARAFTGWDVHDGEPRFQPQFFDAGEKTILGRTGPWGAGDVVRIVLEQPACGRFLVRKLFAEFVSETIEPGEDVLEPLVEGFRVRNYDIAWLMQTMLGSWTFFSDEAMRHRVKSPVEFVLGAVRELDGPAGPLRLAELCERMGQSLFRPPSVKGWDGGGNWLNSRTMLVRQQTMIELTRGRGLGQRTDPARLVSSRGESGDVGLAETFLDLMLQRPDHPARDRIAALLGEERRRVQRGFASASSVDGELARTAAQLVAALPDYQLA